MEAVYGFLFFGTILTLWIVAFVRMHKYGGSKGIQQFFLFLGLTILIGGLLFLIIMVPVLDCSGFLCGLGELLIFFLGCAIVLIVMPIIMMTAVVMRLKKSNPDLLNQFHQKDIIDEV